MNQEKKEIIVYTDGAARGNPGPGGYGLVFLDTHASEVIEQGEGRAHTTNNAMELLAVLEALNIIATKRDLNREYIQVPMYVYTDSRYVHQGVTSWMYGWARNDWRKKDGEVISNKELWSQVHARVQSLSGVSISYVHVPGHSGIPGNERADTIATAYADNDTEFVPYVGRLEGYSYRSELLVPPSDDQIAALRASKKENTKKKTGKALGYLSYVEGHVYFDEQWDQCKERVGGKSGVSFRKVMTKTDIHDLLEKWGVPRDREVIGYES